MNIHFKDEELFNSLLKSSIFQCEVGSGMYKTKTKDSDTDILIIYLEGALNSNSLYKTHHQLQFKKDNIDYIFTSLTQFVNNILSGDSTINYEVLKSDEFKNNSKYFKNLSELKIFNSYNIITSYLGMAKRDLKSLKSSYTGKKLHHFMRGVDFAYSINNNRNIFDTLSNNRDEYLTIKESIDINDYLGKIDLYELKMNNLRDIINRKKFTFTYASKDILEVQEIIYKIINKECFKVQNRINTDKLILEAILENKFNY